MGCPRCDRVRIECDGKIFRCAVCGMPYDPYVGTHSSVLEEDARLPQSFPRSSDLSLKRLFSTARALREADSLTEPPPAGVVVCDSL
jgi:uncharacterized Zn finger protein (UPF0148 family)